MPNLPLAFGEIVVGGVILMAGLSGKSLGDVMNGKFELAGFGGGDSSASSLTTSGTYSSPVPSHAIIGRTDQGVDVSGLHPGDPITAIGNSKVIGIIPNWFNGQPYVWMQFLDGPNAGQYWYAAEQLVPTVHPGQVVPKGQQIGTYAGTGTGLEFGFATANGQTLARSTTGYTEGQATTAGQDFRRLIFGA